MDLNSELAQKIRRQMVATISEYELLSEGDRLLVCVSGGKDSAILLASLTEVQRRAPFRFELAAILLDQKQPGFEGHYFKKWVEETVGVPLHILEEDTYSIVIEKSDSKVYCGLCSRLRRGILYNYAAENGFSKMALGHHRDDAAETLLMNLFYSGQMQAMPPKFRSDDGRNVVIRPLLGVAEADLRALATQWAIPLIPCNLCGSQENMTRKKIKRLLSELEKENPFLRNSIATALTNVRTSHLADPRVWDFSKA